MNRKEVIAVLAYLTGSYVRAAPDDGMIDAWCDQFADLDFGDVWEAAREHVAGSTWFPAIAELRTLATGTSGKTEEDRMARAEAAMLARSTIEVFGLEHAEHAVGAARLADLTKGRSKRRQARELSKADPRALMDGRDA